MCVGALAGIGSKQDDNPMPARVPCRTRYPRTDHCPCDSEGSSPSPSPLPSPPPCCRPTPSPGGAVPRSSSSSARPGATDGRLPNNARQSRLRATAAAAGADVVKVYSPNATWANVPAAVEGANVIVYLGHGNGFPSPHSTTRGPAFSVNGWGLNRTTGQWRRDTWSHDDGATAARARCSATMSRPRTADWRPVGVLRRK